MAIPSVKAVSREDSFSPLQIRNKLWILHGTSQFVDSFNKTRWYLVSQIIVHLLHFEFATNMLLIGKK